jgi:hypothetical protein
MTLVSSILDKYPVSTQKCHLCVVCRLPSATLNSLWWTDFISEPGLIKVPSEIRHTEQKQNMFAERTNKMLNFFYFFLPVSVLWFLKLILWYLARFFVCLFLSFDVYHLHCHILTEIQLRVSIWYLIPPIIIIISNDVKRWCRTYKYNTDESKWLFHW